MLPDFSKRSKERSDLIETLDLEKIQGEQEDCFALKLNAYLKIDEEGLYRVRLTSDDGSRLSLHDEVFIDHDGNHPPMTLSRLTRLAAGLHPIEIEYFEGYGENVLDLKLQRVDEPGEEFTPTFQCPRRSLEKTPSKTQGF